MTKSQGDVKYGQIARLKKFQYGGLEDVFKTTIDGLEAISKAMIDGLIYILVENNRWSEKTKGFRIKVGGFRV